MKPVNYCDYEKAAYDLYGCSLKKKKTEQNYEKKK